MTAAQCERLSILVEELGEALQVAGKILRHGWDSTHPNGGPTNRNLLELELGDVMFAIKFLQMNNDVDTDSIETAAENKNFNVQKYLHNKHRMLS